MSHRVTRCFTRGTKHLLVVVTLVAARDARAQERPLVAATHADELLDQGRWAEAESAFYLQSERAPRDPVARAALGNFLAMKGAIRPGLVLMEEARKFGLDAWTTQSLIAPWREILDWRAAAADFKRDSIFVVRMSARQDVLFEIPLPRTDRDGRAQLQSGASEIVWHDVVDRPIGLDSLGKRGRPVGIELFEALAPSMLVRDGELTLHANQRSSLSAIGRRYQVLRSVRGVRVLMGERRVLSLPDALRELSPTWWQLDLTRGLLVVR